MKVIKFGGTSVGSPESLRSVRSIIESQTEKVIVVVSALGGVTDSLVKVSRLAEEGDTAFRTLLQEIRERHFSMCDGMVEDAEARTILKDRLGALLDRLGNICEGVYMLRVLPRKAEDEILSFGERLSSLIVAEVVKNAELYDSLRFIITERSGRSNRADTESSYPLIREAFSLYGDKDEVAIVPGFISTDRDSGDITNLGRGGSDFTASLIAAALDADSLEIWTDVDGFMTADPRIIRTSYVIDEMSYDEAMELCNFGAKVIYPPTLYAVCRKDIPIIIKNTFNPDAPGTRIHRDCPGSGRIVRGISSIDDICLITLSGNSMVGVVGVDSRIFSALASEGISAFLVSQSASETGISIGVSKADADLAAKALDEVFSIEIGSGAIDPVKIERDLAAVAVVGENMKHSAGIAGKLFGILGRNGISVLACAQGSSANNISFVVERRFLRKTLNVIHDGFFLSEYQELNLFICGVGTVGGQLLGQIAQQREKLMRENNLKINIVGIARSRTGIFDRNGIDPAAWKEALGNGIPLDTQRLRDEVIGMNIFNSVFVDCTASPQVASLYEDFFNHGISVVAANKIAASSDYGMYRRLKETALRKGVKFLFETNVGAGLPIISTINDLCNSGDRILKLEAVLSGTLNFIFNTLSAEVPFSRTVRMAMEQGFAEPDPRIDLSGKDVIRKLVILSREAGYKVSQEDVQAELFIPQDFFSCSQEEFWQKLPSLDEDFERRRRSLEERHLRWRFVAEMNGGKCRVSLREVDSDSPAWSLDGSNNIILLTTERYAPHPMIIRGYGAGAGVTAAGVFADIMRIANI
jgi:bifunctional aspartokinase / homoserine dehydrogenase 1